MRQASETLTLFGAGRMGAALANGWLETGLGARINIIDPHVSPQVQAWLDAGRVDLDSGAPADTLVIAVKPQMFGQLSRDIAAQIGPDTQVLSIMAGISLDQLRRALGTDRVARAMPNTPGMIGKGVTILSLPDTTDTDAAARLTDLLAPLGQVVGPLEEALLPAATALSGCGPAYVFLLAEAMAAAGVAHGLPAGMSMQLACATVEGGGALMESAADSPATLRQNVTSPNGVTQAALEVLMQPGAMPSLFKQAVAAAIARDRALTEEADGTFRQGD